MVHYKKWAHQFRKFLGNQYGFPKKIETSKASLSKNFQNLFEFRQPSIPRDIL